MREAKTTIGFYGATPGYGFQFDDLGYKGMRDKFSEALRKGGPGVLADMVTDEMLEQFGVAARWDDMADRLIDRYKGKASRVVMYLAKASILESPENLAKWGEIARAVPRCDQWRRIKKIYRLSCSAVASVVDRCLSSNDAP